MRIQKLLFLLCGVLAACADDNKTPAPLKHELLFDGSRLSIDLENKKFELQRKNKTLLRIPLAEIEAGIVDRSDNTLSYDPYWYSAVEGLFMAEVPRDLRYRGIESMRLKSSNDSQLVFEVEMSASLKGEIRFGTSAEGFVVDFTPKSLGPAVVLTRFSVYGDAEEGLYGLGEWPDSVNHRGYKRPMQLEADFVLESASNENHAPVPFLIGSSGWGVFVESRRVGLFEVATEEATKTQVSFAAPSLRIHLFSEDHPLDMTRHYYGITGDPKLPAPWGLGPLIWRDENIDQAQVEEDIEIIRDLDLATTAIWIDRPYATAVNTFDFKAEDYPDPKAMVDKAHAFGLRMGVWHTPYLAEEAAALLAEATANSYFPPTQGTLLNKWGVPLDFTNPDAFKWWQSKLRYYTDLGIEGFKLDYGEDVLAGISGGRSVWEFDDGSDERTMHHTYTNLYHQAYAEMLPPDGGFLLCRAARWGDQVNGPIIWPGDLDADMSTHGERRTDKDGKEYVAVGGLPASLRMGLGLGASGFAFYGADTGGYRHSPPDKETFIRWFQQTALSVVMQVGDSSSQTPWEFNSDNGRDQETLDLYRIFARLHLRLFPYLWTYAKNLKVDGRAIQRPLGLAFPDFGVHSEDTYMLGDSLFVAPVIERGATTRALHFPPGAWIDWFKGTIHQEGAAIVDASLMELPLFLRAGGIVPLLRPSIDTLSETSHPVRVDSFASDAGALHLRIFAGPASSFILYDGTEVSQLKAAKTTTVDIKAGSVFTKGYVLELIGEQADPLAVTADGAAIPWTRTSTPPFVLSLELPSGTKQLVVQ